MGSKQKTITLRLTIKEAKQLCANLGGQSVEVSLKHFNTSVTKRLKFNDNMIFNIYDRLCDKLEGMNK